MAAPRALRHLARLLLSERDREFILGDLDELYAVRRRESGPVRASLRYLRETLASAASQRRAGAAARASVGPPRRPGSGIDAVRSDVRDAFRGLRRRPLFVLVVAVTLGIGVGPAGAVFAVVNQIVLRPVAGVRNGGDLAILELRTPERRALGVSAPDVDVLRASADLLEGFAAFDYLGLLVSVDDSRPVEVRAYTIYGAYFEVLGVRPAVGRLISSEETGAGSDPYAAVISESLWSSLFGLDPEVIGRRFDANGVTLTVVGVAGDGFRGTDRFWGVDVWLSRSAYPILTGYPAERWWSAQSRLMQDFIVRPRAGVGLPAAEEQLDRSVRDLAASSPESYLADARADLHRGVMDPQIQAMLGGAMAVLAGLGLLILFIPCANLAGLLLVRSAHRRG